MLFHSFHFLLFFPIVVATALATPNRWRWLILLIASYYFYAVWNPIYSILIVSSTLCAFYGARQMHTAQTPSAKRLWLYSTIAVQLGVLFLFKYWNFFSITLAALRFDIPTINLLLPIGISFYTFQSISYIVDIYRNKIEPETHLGYFALFITFFPQLVAGPIERSANMLPQIRAPKRPSYDVFCSGLQLMLWGFFKKIVIADRAAVFVDAVFTDTYSFTGLPLLMAIVLFSIQIYCDFSGYSDIAIGSARAMGFRLTQNFNRPYLSQSIGDFWRRWHITLYNWFRDYIYIPLGGSRTRTIRNILIVFGLSGLWHGAAWTFVVWGLLHGIYITISRYVSCEHLPHIIKILCTFVLVTLTWIPFRAESIEQAWYIFTSLVSNLSFAQLSAVTQITRLSDLCITFMAIMMLITYETLQEKPLMKTTPWWLRWSAYYGLLLAITFFGRFSGQEFIYFQF